MSDDVDDHGDDDDVKEEEEEEEEEDVYGVRCIKQVLTPETFFVCRVPVTDHDACVILMIFPLLVTIIIIIIIITLVITIILVTMEERNYETSSKLYGTDPIHFDLGDIVSQ